MYKSRVKVWLIVLGIYLLVHYLYPIASNSIINAYTESQNKYKEYPATASISSDNIFIKRNVNEKTVKKTELTTSDSPDIYISSKKTDDGTLFYNLAGKTPKL